MAQLSGPGSWGNQLWLGVLQPAEAEPSKSVPVGNLLFFFSGVFLINSQVHIFGHGMKRPSLRVPNALLGARGSLQLAFLEMSIRSSSGAKTHGTHGTHGTQLPGAAPPRSV